MSSAVSLLAAKKIQDCVLEPRLLLPGPAAGNKTQMTTVRHDEGLKKIGLLHVVKWEELPWKKRVVRGVDEQGVKADRF